MASEGAEKNKVNRLLRTKRTMGNYRSAGKEQSSKKCPYNHRKAQIWHIKTNLFFKPNLHKIGWG